MFILLSTRKSSLLKRELDNCRGDYPHFLLRNNLASFENLITKDLDEVLSQTFRSLPILSSPNCHSDENNDRAFDHDSLD